MYRTLAALAILCLLFAGLALTLPLEAVAGPAPQAKIATIEGGIPYAVPLRGCSLRVGSAVEVRRQGQVVATGRVNASGSFLTLGLDRGYVLKGDLVYPAAPGRQVAAQTYPSAPAIPRRIPAPPAAYNRTGDSPVVVVLPGNGINAFATYYRGQPVIAVTERMGQVVYALSYYTAATAANGNSEGARKAQLLALASAAGSNYIPPPPYVAPQHRAWVEQEAATIYTHMMTYVLAHEYGHLSLGHVRAAFSSLGLSRNVNRYVDTHLLGRLYAQRQCELDADAAALSATVGLYGPNAANSIKIFCVFMAMYEDYAGSPPEYLSSHPSWMNRLGWIEHLLGY